MLVASDDATSGSVIANADRMRAVEQRGEPALLLLGGAEHRQHLHVAGVRGRAVERRRREVAGAAGDLGQRCVLEVGQAGAVLVAGQEEVPEPALAGLGAQLLEHRRGRPGERVVHRLELVVEDLLGRLDLGWP